MKDLTSEQAHWAPPGNVHPLGATYAHTVMGEDYVLHRLLMGGDVEPLATGAWAGKTGVSEPMPPFGRPWAEWAWRVQVDLPAMRNYAKRVYSATDEYLASLTADDLDQTLDLRVVGKQSLAWVWNTFVVEHINNHIGEIASIKGLQGLKGYPF